MKKNITAVLVFVLTGCQSQSKIDLSEIALDNKLNVEKLNLVQQTDLDQTTGLSYYSTNEAEKYRYEDLNFVIEYPKKKKYLKSSIGFLISNSILDGVFISTYNFKESEELFNILTKKYGKPNVINIANANWPYSGYYWKQTKDGFDILLGQSMEKLNIEGKNVSGYTTEVYFVKQDLKIGKMETRETVLENFIKAHKQ